MLPLGLHLLYLLGMVLITGGLAPERVWRAARVLTLFAAAYLAEAVRSGLEAVPRGQLQLEASRSLDMSMP
jgi:general L-amino acid transport system permease protein